jgi:hypothetical protein
MYRTLASHSVLPLLPSSAPARRVVGQFLTDQKTIVGVGKTLLSMALAAGQIDGSVRCLEIDAATRRQMAIAVAATVERCAGVVEEHCAQRCVCWIWTQHPPRPPHRGPVMAAVDAVLVAACVAGAALHVEGAGAAEAAPAAPPEPKARPPRRPKAREPRPPKPRPAAPRKTFARPMPSSQRSL